jgi:LuxR family transcriptional regulator, maltose regulon positive regulatory protein
MTGRGLFLRPLLLATLHARFERPLTAVVAAAGFGKTTLLARPSRRALQDGDRQRRSLRGT